MNKHSFLQIDEQDNLIVALQSLDNGTTVAIGTNSVKLKQDIPKKHKFALCDLNSGDNAFMYGVTVGVATRFIQAGELITTQNLRHATTAYAEEKKQYKWIPPEPAGTVPQEFMGFRRSNGGVGTANYWIFVPLVFCSNQELLSLKDILPQALGFKKASRYEVFTCELVRQMQSGSIHQDHPIIAEPIDEHYTSPVFPNVDGLKFLTHSAGCGGTRGDAKLLCGLLAGYITHPNVAGATVISLGCQNAEVSLLKKEIESRDPGCGKPILFFDRQSWRGPQDMTEVVIQKTLLGLQEANKVRREPVPVNELVVGVECGGSDGFSGISANPVIGRTVDHLIGSGASAMLSEFPELCGVENELTARCITPGKADRFLELINTYREQVQLVGVDFDMNPSPGNIKDGLITDAMKSAGAAKKGGTAPIVDVLDYPEPLTQKGLNLLCTPGNDVESTTALAGSGANLIIFSTGLGTPTGNPVVPVIKVSSNSAIAERLAHMIDFDAGPVISGKKTIKTLAKELLTLCVQTASGTYRTKAVNLGQDDFIPWKRDVSL